MSSRFESNVKAHFDCFWRCACKTARKQPGWLQSAEQRASSVAPSPSWQVIRRACGFVRYADMAIFSHRSDPVPALTFWFKRRSFINAMHGQCAGFRLWTVLPRGSLWDTTRTYRGADHVTLPFCILFFLQWTTESCRTPRAFDF